MTRETIRDFIPWEDYYESRDNLTQLVKRMFADIKRAIKLNKRTLNENKNRRVK
jgi:hypothetical protein|tara:strand:+ start:1260 stop:1421 length:162 start_codon:yes stop_codon:yes gene_type:complete